MECTPQVRFKVPSVLRVEITTPQSPPVSPKILRSAQWIEDFSDKKYVKQWKHVYFLLHVYGGYMEEDSKVYDICVASASHCKTGSNNI